MIIYNENYTFRFSFFSLYVFEHRVWCISNLFPMSCGHFIFYTTVCSSRINVFFSWLDYNVGSCQWETPENYYWCTPSRDSYTSCEGMQQIHLSKCVKFMNLSSVIFIFVYLCSLQMTQLLQCAMTVEDQCLSWHSGKSYITQFILAWCSSG